MGRRGWRGLVAAAALLGTGLPGAGTAWAEAPAGRARTAVPRGAREVVGRVLLVEREGVFLLDRAGVITLLGLTPGTRFEGAALRRVSDLKAGQEVRATWEWRGADGVATRIRQVPGGTVEGGGQAPGGE